MTDNRFIDLGVDERFKDYPVDDRFPSANTDTRFPEPGTDTRFQGTDPYGPEMLPNGDFNLVGADITNPEQLDGSLWEAGIGDALTRTDPDGSVFGSVEAAGQTGAFYLGWFQNSSGSLTIQLPYVAKIEYKHTGEPLLNFGLYNNEDPFETYVIVPVGDAVEYTKVEAIIKPGTSTSFTYFYSEAAGLGAATWNHKDLSVSRVGEHWSFQAANNAYWTIKIAPEGGYYAFIDGSQPAGTDLSSDMLMPVEAGKTYRVTYTVRDYVAGGVAIRLGNVTGTYRFANGDFEQITTATSAQALILRTDSGGAFHGGVDNISMKEILPLPTPPLLETVVGWWDPENASNQIGTGGADWVNVVADGGPNGNDLDTWTWSTPLRYDDTGAGGAMPKACFWGQRNIGSARALADVEDGWAIAVIQHGAVLAGSNRFVMFHALQVTSGNTTISVACRVDGVPFAAGAFDMATKAGAAPYILELEEIANSAVYVGEGVASGRGLNFRVNFGDALIYDNEPSENDKDDIRKWLADRWGVTVAVQLTFGYAVKSPQSEEDTQFIDPDGPGAGEMEINGEVPSYFGSAGDDVLVLDLSDQGGDIIVNFGDNKYPVRMIFDGGVYYYKGDNVRVLLAELRGKVIKIKYAVVDKLP